MIQVEDMLLSFLQNMVHGNNFPLSQEEAKDAVDTAEEAPAGGEEAPAEALPSGSKGVPAADEGEDEAAPEELAE